MKAKHYVGLIAFAMVFALWIRAETQRQELEREIGHIYVGDCTIHAIDAETKAPITLVFTGPVSSMGQQWPKYFITSAVDPSQIRVRWLSVEPVEVGVSSIGYEEVPMTLGADSKREIVVPLHRSPGRKSAGLSGEGQG